MQLKSLSVLCIAMVGSGAFAQTKPPEPDYTLAYNVGVVSDYRFRGLTQSRFDPALQAGIDFGHKSGFYLGAWASSIKWIKDAGGNADAEIDLYGGYKGSVSDMGYDFGVLTYQYPSNRLTPSANTTELNYDFGNGLVASLSAVGTDADKALYVTPSGRFTGRDSAVAGLKYSF